MDNSGFDWKRIVLIAGAWLFGGGGLAAGLVVGWVFLVPLLASVASKAPVDVSVPVGPAPVLERVPRVTVTPKAPVKVYAPSAAAKLKLPADVAQNPAEHVITATTVRSSERPQTITTTINTETGESRSFVKQDPYPWFAIETRGEARLAAGIKYDRTGQLTEVVRLAVGYDIVRVKALTAGVLGTIDSDGATFLGVGIAYRW